MKLTPEQKAAKAAARAANREARKPLISAGGEKAMAATLENVVDTMDERLEALPDGEEFDAMRGEFTTMKADVEDVKKRFKLRGGGNTEGMDVKAFSIGKLVKAFISGRFEDTMDGIGYELEVLEATYKEKGFTEATGKPILTKKDLITTLQGGAGGIPLAPQISQTIKEAARSQSVLFGMGVVNDNVEGTAGFSIPYEVNKDQTDVTTGRNMAPGFVLEGGAVSQAARPGFRLANFSPKKMAMIVGITEEISKLGGNFISAFVNRVAAKDMRTTLERSALTGRGNQFSEPMGLFNRSDLSAVNLGVAMPTNGRFLTPSDFRDMEMDLAEVDRLMDNCKFLTRPAALRNLAHEAHTQGISTATEANSMPRTPMSLISYKKWAEILGIDLRITTNVPKNFTQGTTTTTTALAFGCWDNLWIPFWGPMEMLLSREATVGGVSAYENCLAYVRFVQMYDCNVIDPKAFIVKKGFLTA